MRMVSKKHLSSVNLRRFKRIPVSHKTFVSKPVEKVVEVKEEKTEANEEQIIPAVFSAEEMNVQNNAEVLETPKPKRTRKKKVVEEPQDENVPVVETENNEEKTENDG